MISATLFNDPACPWGYSANPQFRVLEWRFGAQLDWRLVLIGLREQPMAGYDPVRAAGRWGVFRQRYGMPFSLAPKARAAGTGRGCRAVVAARLIEPGSEWLALRSLQLANFNSDLLLDDDESIRTALRGVPGLDADAIVDRLDDPEVEEAYQRDRAETRSAAGTPIHAQGKHAESDGAVRFTAPSLVFERHGRRLDAGGWQPIISYDTVIANLDPTLERTPPPDSPEPLLERFPYGLATAEVAALLASGPDEVPDVAAAEQALVELVGSGVAQRVPLGQDALWLPAGAEPPRFGASAAA